MSCIRRPVFRGRLALAAPAAALLAAAPLALAAAGPAQAAAGAARTAPGNGPVTMRFGYTGSDQRLILPPGVQSITVTAAGGMGGHGADGPENSGGAGGNGSLVHADSIPLPGRALALFIFVGGDGGGGHRFFAGDGGFNGGGNGASTAQAGGGGGASDVRLNGTDPSDQVIVAGGGGGGGADGKEGNGGLGGGLFGPNGSDGHSNPINPLSCHGRGGDAGAPNGGGRGGDSPCAGDGIGGARLSGGRGGTSAGFEGGGGGGGGYYGGGGGGGGLIGSGAGGGAGSSYFAPGSAGTSVGRASTAAFVDVTYTPPAPTLTCTQHVTITIGQVIGGILLCRTDRGAGIRFTGDGPPPGCIVVANDNLLEIGTDYLTEVGGPPRDYHYTVTAFSAGQETTDRVTVTVTGPPTLGVTGGLGSPPPL
jgi:hypothetical protein